MATACDSSNGDKDAKPLTPQWRFDYVSSSPDASVFDVAAVSKNEGWAMGREWLQEGVSTYFLLHRHGAAWRRAEMPLRPAKGADFAGTQLDASGPDNVWLFAGQIESDGVEEVGTPTAVRWDGHRWLTTSVDFGVQDVAVLAPDDVWALGTSVGADGTIAHHWDGTRWTSHALHQQADALSASGPDDVWAAGYDDHQPAITHFDGTRWLPVPTPKYGLPRPKPNEAAALTEIVAISSDNAWAFGSHTYTSDESPSSEIHDTAFALHWDGSRWREAPKALNSSVRINPYPAMSATGDGADGFVLGGQQHLGADGRLSLIKEPELVAGRSGKITPVDRSQRFHLSDLQLVPGTHEIWSVGYVTVDLSGDANFMRGVVASYSTGG